MTEPKRVVTADLGDGARRVVLACSCAKVGRVVTRWESEGDTVAQLLVDHGRVAPRCPHPRPVTPTTSRTST